MCRSCPTVDESEWRAASHAATQEVHVISEPTTPYVLWFDDFEESQRPRVGGKNASLGTMMAAGLPVPPGFAVTTDAYDTLRTYDDLGAQVNDALRGVDYDDARGLQKVSAEIRGAIETVPVDPAIEDGIRQAYTALSDRCGVREVPVAVRSSATAEDMPDASFAGQQDTFLWVTGAESVIQDVRRCWSSVFTDRAIAYRRQMRYDVEQISMSVGVQKMVDPKAAGVAFTLNPLNGDRSQVAIDASWGLGEAVVSGEVTPDNYLVDKVLKTIGTRIISHKHIEYRLEGESVRVCDVDPERQDVPCLTDEEICAVATMARRAEKHYGRPQDIEWALDRHLPDGQNVILLQARPETVWSQKSKAPIVAGGYDPMKSIVSTLLSPMHDKQS